MFWKPCLLTSLIVGYGPILCFLPQIQAQELNQTEIPHAIEILRNGKQAKDRIPIQNPLGFDTYGDGKNLRSLWESVKDHKKMQGKVSDHLTRDHVEAIIALEVGIAIAYGPGGMGFEEELLRFMSKGNQFETGPLPAEFEKDGPRKHLVALVRTKSGDYGLVTCYSKLAVLELKGRIGIVPIVHKEQRKPFLPNQ